MKTIKNTHRVLDPNEIVRTLGLINKWKQAQINKLELVDFDYNPDNFEKICIENEMLRQELFALTNTLHNRNFATFHQIYNKFSRPANRRFVKDSITALNNSLKVNEIDLYTFMYKLIETFSSITWRDMKKRETKLDFLIRKGYSMHLGITIKMMQSFESFYVFRKALTDAATKLKLTNKSKNQDDLPF